MPVPVLVLYLHERTGMEIYRDSSPAAVDEYLKLLGLLLSGTSFMQKGVNWRSKGQVTVVFRMVDFAVQHKRPNKSWLFWYILASFKIRWSISNFNSFLEVLKRERTWLSLPLPQREECTLKFLWKDVSKSTGSDALQKVSIRLRIMKDNFVGVKNKSQIWFLNGSRLSF